MREVHDADGWLRLWLTGEFDLAVTDQVTTRLAELGRRQASVVLDISELSFIDSSGIAVLVHYVECARNDGWNLRIAPDASDAVRKVLSLLGVDAILWRPDSSEPGQCPRVMTNSRLNNLAAKLESVQALDGPAKLAGRTVRKLIPDGAPKKALSGAWLGHALHPLLTDIPIGTWTSSVLLDWIGGENTRSGADRLILTGLLAAGAVVTTGWSDWADIEQVDDAARRSGLVHAAANATATGLMIGSYIARKQGVRGRGKVLALAGTAAMGAGGWLGGHLSYTLGVGVTPRTPAG